MIITAYIPALNCTAPVRFIQKLTDKTHASYMLSATAGLLVSELINSVVKFSQ